MENVKFVLFMRELSPRKYARILSLRIWSLS